MDRVQSGAGVRRRIHHRVLGGEAGREPQQEPDPAGESGVSRHHQNGGGTLLLVSLSFAFCAAHSEDWFGKQGHFYHCPKDRILFYIFSRKTTNVRPNGAFLLCEM